MLKKLNRDNFSQQAGFTIVELLVVIFIISLLSTFVFASYRTGQKKYALSQSAQQLISKLREAQNIALSGVEVAGYYGCGLYLEPGDDFYILYADENRNSSHQPSDITIETIYLLERISIDSTLPISSKLDIFFESPHATTHVNGDEGIGVSGAVTFSVEGTALNKTIMVTTAGLIQSN